MKGSLIVALDSDTSDEEVGEVQAILAEQFGDDLDVVISIAADFGDEEEAEDEVDDETEEDGEDDEGLSEDEILAWGDAADEGDEDAEAELNKIIETENLEIEGFDDMSWSEAAKAIVEALSEEDGEEEDAEEEEQGEEEEAGEWYSAEELATLGTQELKDILTENDLEVPTGRGNQRLIDAILAAGDDEGEGGEDEDEEDEEEIDEDELRAMRFDRILKLADDNDIKVSAAIKKNKDKDALIGLFFD